MPNLPMHIFMAQQAAERLDWGFAYDCVGSYYLGSNLSGAVDIAASQLSYLFDGRSQAFEQLFGDGT